ncbi:MAG: 2-polyprenylphenol 6-hydroxylase [Hyphomicrobiales bacterium]|nr:2-polyprenylphenol 6-hydroxylase [Hyphomicrobiales bacterium]
MTLALVNLARLANAGWVLMRHGAQVIPDTVELPEPVRLFSRVTSRLRERRNRNGKDKKNETRLSTALTSLGPSYIKLGQFLATRDDLVGRDLARDLSKLQDKLPPFSMAEARKALEDELGRSVEDLFDEFGPPLAAASIAQVHKAYVRDAAGERRPRAVKILRPGIERRFGKDLDAYVFAARLVERFHAPARRLKPLAVVETLAKSVAIEMDLRMEAAAISEMAENTSEDDGFKVPQIDWSLSGRRVLTLEWIDGTPIADHDALREAGHDLKHLGTVLIQSFLRHAMRDGFFHADMHPGNLFVDAAGDIVAVDFGIMGRLGPKEQRFLAEILHGFITRNYRRVAEVHFEAGYVPRKHSVELFAQALRAIGEPLMDRTAEEISMGHLLGQLFQYTEVFDMPTQTQLILLQKTMVVVEGVARALDPRLNIWTTAEPVAQEWMDSHFGPEGRLQDAAEGAASVGRLVGDLPQLLSQAEQAAESFSAMAADGLRLDAYTIDRLAEAQARHGRLARWGIWIGALSLLAIAVSLLP